jgi:hypothetical protein
MVAPSTRSLSRGVALMVIKISYKIKSRAEGVVCQV